VDAPPRPVPYARAFFYQRAVGLLAVFIFVLLVLALQTRTPAEWLAVVAGVLFYMFWTRKKEKDETKKVLEAAQAPKTPPV